MPDSPLLQILEAWEKDPTPPTGADVYEYRFVLSGCAYNGDLEGDYTKAAFGGLLLEHPFPVWKVGHSYDDYPQELVAWLKVAPVTREKENFSSTGTPHELAADELAAVLTLFLRRLVTVAGAIAVTIPEYYAKAPLRSPVAMPVVLKSREARVWPRLPLTVRWT